MTFQHSLYFQGIVIKPKVSHLHSFMLSLSNTDGAGGE